MRRSVSAILAGGIATAFMVAAAPAGAKGCERRGCPPPPPPVKIQVTLAGPDLTAPIVIRGADGWSMLNVSGANYRPYRVFDEVPAELGPRYQVVYEFRHRGELLGRLRQDLYPYAAGRPFAFTPEGQKFFDRYWEPVKAAKGWRGSRTLEWILEEHGLPEDPLGGSDAGVRAAGAATDGGATPPWWLGGILALGALVLVPRLRRRPA